MMLGLVHQVKISNMGPTTILSTRPPPHPLQGTTDLSPLLHSFSLSIRTRGSSRLYGRGQQCFTKLVGAPVSLVRSRRTEALSGSGAPVSLAAVRDQWHSDELGGEPRRCELVDGVYAYPISFGLASGQVLHRSQGTLLPSSVNPRYRICGTNV
jgi:hypothetical protein